MADLPFRRIEFVPLFGYTPRLFPIGGQNKIRGDAAPERVQT